MRKFLVVDDCSIQRSHMESILKKEGYEVRSIDDGSKALEVAESYNPDLIFMDVNMPGQDGFATTRELKGCASTKDIPIVFVTVKGQKADKAWGKILGAKGHITKPYEDIEIISLIHSL